MKGCELIASFSHINKRGGLEHENLKESMPSVRYRHSSCCNLYCTCRHCPSPPLPPAPHQTGQLPPAPHQTGQLLPPAPHQTGQLPPAPHQRQHVAVHLLGIRVSPLDLGSPLREMPHAQRRGGGKARRWHRH